MSRFTRDEAIQILPKFALADKERSDASPSREFFSKKKMKVLRVKKIA